MILVVGVLVFAFAIFQTVQKINEAVSYNRQFHTSPQYYDYIKTYYPNNFKKATPEPLTIFIYFVGAALGVTGVIIMKKSETTGIGYSSGSFKKCPFCANDIKREAVVCQFCRKDLPKEEIKSIAQQIMFG